jgi:geranylgeranyl transferase type-2 subunit beta
MSAGASGPSSREDLVSDADDMQLHRRYVLGEFEAMERKESFQYCVTEHLGMSGVYWGQGAMSLLHALEEMDTVQIIPWVLACQHDCGGFGGNVQVLAAFGELGRIDSDKVASYVAGLQQKDGSFAGDEWGEIDTRFSYCALNCLRLLDKLETIQVDDACNFIASCANFDGGFGCLPGAESHAGQIFTCVGALAIANQLHRVDADLLGWWLAERQTSNGGLNGRPEKLSVWSPFQSIP